MGTVHNLRNRREKLLPGLTLERMVFFGKADAMVGTVFVYHGRRNSGATYRVEAITSWTTKRDGVRKPQWQDMRRVAKLGDRLTLRNTKTGERREVSFQYLSYSAIWWLARVVEG
jgi:hypothetical protein